MSKLGFIGLGAIGTPMALRLLDAGHELHVWGRTPSRLQPVLDRGARGAASAAELAATCEAVLLCVTDTAAVEAVALGPQGLAAGAKPGLLVIDHSTIDPARTLIPGTAGDFSWGGMASTYFWIDPRVQLIVIFMTQLMPSATYPIRRELRTLVYSAFT